MMSRNRSRALCILLFESLLTCLCGAAAIWIRFGSEASELLSSALIWAKIIALLLVMQGAFYIFGLYDFSTIRQRATLYMRLFQATGFASIALAVVFYLFPRLMLGRGVFLVSLLLMLTVMSCWRMFATWLLGHPRLAERILILGTE